MNVIQQEAAGREWAYQLRELAADLGAQGQPGRARELTRLAVETEREVATLHAAVAQRGTCDGEGWCCHGHPSVAEALCCAAGRIHPIGASKEASRLRGIIGRAADRWYERIRGNAAGQPAEASS